MGKPALTIDRQSAQLLVLLSVLWGGSFFFTGVALRDLPPLTIVLVRVAFGAVLLLPFLKASGARCRKASQAGCRFSAWACSIT
jgi:drug/metabolite transporter (DMT)-like permease